MYEENLGGLPVKSSERLGKQFRGGPVDLSRLLYMYVCCFARSDRGSHAFPLSI